MTVAQDFEARRQAIVEAHLKPAEDRPASAARGVHHLALICSDVEQTVRFYQDVLGFPLVDVMENRDYPGSTHFFHDIGNDNLLAFFDFPGLGLGEAVEAIGAVQHVAISVDRPSFEQIRDRLDAADLPYLGPDRGLTNSIYVKDPDASKSSSSPSPCASWTAAIWVEPEAKPRAERFFAFSFISLVDRTSVCYTRSMRGRGRSRPGGSPADVSWADTFVAMAEKSAAAKAVDHPHRDRHLVLLHLSANGGHLHLDRD